jgi:predicted RNA-binding Zn-ribbon protein involved in translation (DUF1610 family)
VWRLKKIKEKIRKFFAGRYGLDDLGKLIVWVSLITYVLGRLFKNSVLLFISLIGAISFFFRFFSKEVYDRSDENCKYKRYIRSWKLKYEYRKTAKIYMCPQCGKMIRVPKGKGKLQITCPSCKHTITRYT